MELNKLTIKQARELLNKGEITSVELTKACFNRIKETDSKVKACLDICEESALLEAKEADIRIKAGEKGDLLGIPYTVKDNILTKGIKTTAASKMLENYIAPFDATIIKKLKSSGAVLVAKVNLDEFAHGASTENSAFGTTHNPWNLDKVPGGSSGGSAASIIADMAMFSIGTDTGGSVRCPASFCGVVGLKPTYGRSSRFGLISMTSSTDVPGVLAKTVEDSALVLKIIAGVDGKDATTVDEKIDDYLAEINNEVKGLKIGIYDEFFGEGVDSEVKEAVKKAISTLEEMGAEIVPISLPDIKYSIPVYYIITPSEISSNLARFDGVRYGFKDEEAKNIAEIYIKSRGKGFGAEVKRRIMLGTYSLSAGYRDAYYLQAQKVRTKIKEELDNELTRIDCILTPTQPTTAFGIGENTTDPLKMYLEDIFVAGPSLAGLPAISIPCGFADGLPIGMQLIGRRFDEKRLFNIGHKYEQATEFHKEKPNI